MFGIFLSPPLSLQNKQNGESARNRIVCKNTYHTQEIKSSCTEFQGLLLYQAYVLVLLFFVRLCFFVIFRKKRKCLVVYVCTTLIYRCCAFLYSKLFSFFQLQHMHHVFSSYRKKNRYVQYVLHTIKQWTQSIVFSMVTSVRNGFESGLFFFIFTHICL